VLWVFPFFIDDSLSHFYLEFGSSLFFLMVFLFLTTFVSIKQVSHFLFLDLKNDLIGLNYFTKKLNLFHFLLFRKEIFDFFIIFFGFESQRKNIKISIFRFFNEIVHWLNFNFLFAVHHDLIKEF
jgi:hypothetical protein